MKATTTGGGAAERAFVIQFAIGEDGRRGLFSGRAEHVASGDSIRFGSPEELTAFLARKVGARVQEGAD